MKKLLSITLAAALMVGSLSTVAFGAETEAEILPGNGQKIGVSMPTKDLQRWNLVTGVQTCALPICFEQCGYDRTYGRAAKQSCPDERTDP